MIGRRRKAEALGLAAALLLLLAVVVFRTRAQPQDPPAKPAPSSPIAGPAPLPLAALPEPQPGLRPPVAEDIEARRKRFEETHAKAPPPAPKEPERIRWVGPLSVMIRVLAPRESGSTVPVVYLSRLPVPIEITLGRVPDREIPPLPVDPASWSAALTAMLAREGDPGAPLPCPLHIEGIFRGATPDPLASGGNEPVPIPDAGLTIRARVQPLQILRTPGKYDLRILLDANPLLKTVDRWELQTSPKASFEMRGEGAPEDPIRAKLQELSALVERRSFAEAIRTAEEIIAVRPTSVAAHYHQALSLWKSDGDVNRAILLMQRALQHLERNEDPDPAYRDLDERTRGHMRGTFRNWIEERKREQAGRADPDK
jgi:hypothetical protein